MFNGIPSRGFVLAALICVGSSAIAQRPLCTELPASERDRARAAGLCRDPAPIVDVAPPSPRELVRVPRVTNINLNEARQRLQKDLDLKVQPVVVTSDLRVGTVIEQQPAEGTLVKRGSVVRLQVSAGQEGPEIIDVPNVVGMPFDRAKSRLARFTVQRTERPRGERSNGAPEGQVIEQAPHAATRAAAGSLVALTVSGAPRATIEIFEMPNVVGRVYADVSRSLAEFNVSRTDVDNAAPREQIIAQTPAAGSTLMPGDAVGLQVSAGAGRTAFAATRSSSSAAPEVASARGVLAVGASVALGLIIGALLMRHWLTRQRVAAAADDVITSLSPTVPQPTVPQPITSVDILLDDDDTRRARDDAVQSERTEWQATDAESQDDQDKEPGPDKPENSELESPRSK
jgi:beta-lactam-binding protein with PASTA domain